MPKTRCKCPRCGYDKARPNARGPDHIHCKKCGGLVPVNYTDDGPYSDNPIASVLANERGEANQGVRLPMLPTPERGGL